MANKIVAKLSIAVLAAVVVVLMPGFASSQDDDQTRNVLKQGLVGAGAGALAAGTSGGNAGQGALIGAGTSVIGGALLDAITTPSSSSARRRSAPPPQDEYYTDEYGNEYYYEDAPVQPQQSGSTQVLKSGLVGAGTGAIAAGASGGNAGKGALIGAGTAVIGNALLDTITQPSQPKPRRVYRRAPQPAPKKTVRASEETSDVATDEGRKKVIKKYDESGKLVSEEEVYY